MTGIRPDNLLSLTSDIVTAHISNNEVEADQLPALIAQVHRTLKDLRRPTQAAQPQPAQKPAVAIAASVKPDHIVCLEDGKKLKMLKRHLLARYDMTAEDYRAKWKLPADYPMVAPDYAASRSDIAKRGGFGQIKAGGAKADNINQYITSIEAAPADEAPVPVEAEPIAQPAAAEPVASATPVEPREPIGEAPRRKLLKPIFSRGGETRPQDAGPAESPAPTDALGLLRRAIATESCVNATYNKRRVTLAPHIVYTRHEEPYLRAVTVNLDGQKPREMKLGTFKVAGLGDVDQSLSGFARFPDFSPNDPDYAGVTLAVIGSKPASRTSGLRRAP